jgi:radical SAM protein with 4Fe4S-binding SPASM domain
MPPAGGGGSECAERGLLCGGGRSCFVVDWRGELRACNRLPMREPLLRDGFAAAWGRLNRAANAWPQIAECAGCPYENVCDRCAAQLRQFAEPGQRPVEHCERTRYLVSRGVLPASECQLK